MNDFVTAHEMHFEKAAFMRSTDEPKRFPIFYHGFENVFNVLSVVVSYQWRLSVRTVRKRESLKV